MGGGLFSLSPLNTGRPLFLIFGAANFAFSKGPLQRTLFSLALQDPGSHTIQEKVTCALCILIHLSMPPALDETVTCPPPPKQRGNGLRVLHLAFHSIAISFFWTPTSVRVDHGTVVLTTKKAPKKYSRDPKTPSQNYLLGGANLRWPCGMGVRHTVQMQEINGAAGRPQSVPVGPLQGGARHDGGPHPSPQ